MSQTLNQKGLEALGSIQNPTRGLHAHFACCPARAWKYKWEKTSPKKYSAKYYMGSVLFCSPLQNYTLSNGQEKIIRK